MRYKYDKKKYVADRHFEMKKLFIYREASHARVLEKCREVTWPDSPADAEYFLADGGGTIISNHLVIDQADGTDKLLEWTLEAYIQVSRTKYQSKARFNVLMKPVHPYQSKYWRNIECLK